MITNVRGALSRMCWSREDEKFWALNGILTQVSILGMDCNLSLLMHVQVLASTDGWDVAKTVLDFHADALLNIRSLASTRLRCLLSTYCYLRDASKANWTSNKLQSAHNRQVMSLLGEQRRLF